MSEPLKLVFCTYPSLYSDVILARLLACPQVQLVGVVLSTRQANLNDSAWRGAWRHLRRSGLHYSLYLWMVTDGYLGLRRLLGLKTLRQVVREAAIPVHETADINAQDALAFLQGCQPDLLLSAHFNQYLKAEVLALPLQGCWNIHPSTLPAYQGVDPAFYALLRNEQTSGVSVHWQTEQVDAGDLLAQVSLSEIQSLSLMELNERLFELGGDEVVKLLQRGAWQGTAQTGPGHYDSWPSAQQVRAFRRTHRLLSWTALKNSLRRF